MTIIRFDYDSGDALHQPDLAVECVPQQGDVICISGVRHIAAPVAVSPASNIPFSCQKMARFYSAYNYRITLSPMKVSFDASSKSKLLAVLRARTFAFQAKPKDGEITTARVGRYVSS